MKQKLASVLLMLSILTVGCAGAEDGGAATLAVPEASEAPETAGAQEASDAVGAESEAGAESESGAEPEAETVEYGYENLYLSVDIPAGWEYEIKTAEDMAKEDGLETCAIRFWATEFPDTVFEFSYRTMFGMCGTGVSVEEFTLANGLSGYRYTETGDGILWLTITLHNPSNDKQGGTYAITASPELAVWDTLEPEFEQILSSIWVR